MIQSVESTLNERGQRYGSFDKNIECVAHIVGAMINVYDDKHGEAPRLSLVAEWHYLAIKMARIAADPNYTDNYHDLAGYATLLETRHGK